MRIGHVFWASLFLLSVGALAPSTTRAYEPQHVFITNRGGANVIELDESLSFTRTWFGDQSFEGAYLDQPNGMAFTPDGSFFIADTNNQRVLAFDATGAFLRAFSTSSRLGMSVESIYFDGTGVMYASANPGVGVIGRYTALGADLPDVGGGGSFTSLGNVNLTHEGLIIVSDFSGANRGLRELDPSSGHVVRSFGEDLGRQEDVMIDGADRIFVAHWEHDEVVVYGPPPERAELYRFTAPPALGMSLSQPSGIALTSDCLILVASYLTGSIFVFKHLGSAPPVFDRVLRPGIEIPAAASLSLPESIAVSGLGLPGSFNEFAQFVPSCDTAPPPVAVDGGVDAGSSSDGDAGTISDDGSVEARDASIPIEPGGTRGCACSVTGAPLDASSRLWSNLPGLRWCVALMTVVGWRSRRRRRC